MLVKFANSASKLATLVQVSPSMVHNLGRIRKLAQEDGSSNAQGRLVQIIFEYFRGFSVGTVAVRSSLGGISRIIVEYVRGVCPGGGAAESTLFNLCCVIVTCFRGVC